MDAVTLYQNENETVKHAGGRPSKYDDETLNKTKWYFDNWKKLNHAVPSIVGLADYLEVDRRTLYRWADDELRPEFCHMLARLLTRQELTLLNAGLNNTLNSNIVKLALTKHGYSDRSEVASVELGKGAKDKNFQVTFPTREEVIRDSRLLEREKEVEQAFTQLLIERAKLEEREDQLLIDLKGLEEREAALV